MKITPISSGSGQPGTMVGNIELGSSTNREKKANAVKAFKGESPVSIQASDTPVDPLVANQKKRTITMKTNATPGYVPPEIEASPQVENTILAPSETAPESEDTKPLSPQFAALARQKRALQVKEREIAEREQKLLTAQPQATSGIDVEKLKSDPMGVLQEAGLLDTPEFYNQLADRIMGNQSGNSQELKALQEKIQSLEKSLDTKFTERDQQTEQQALTQIRREVDLISAKGDEYEMIRATNSQPEVVELIHRTWKKTGELLDSNEAAKLVEDELVGEVTNLTKLKKIQGQQQPAAQIDPAQARPMRTLTGRDGSSASLNAKQRAILAFNGNLKRG